MAAARFPQAAHARARQHALGIAATPVVGDGEFHAALGQVAQSDADATRATVPHRVVHRLLGAAVQRVLGSGGRRPGRSVQVHLGDGRHAVGQPPQRRHQSRRQVGRAARFDQGAQLRPRMREEIVQFVQTFGAAGASELQLQPGGEQQLRERVVHFTRQALPFLQRRSEARRLGAGLVQASAFQRRTELPPHHAEERQLVR